MTAKRSDELTVGDLVEAEQVTVCRRVTSIQHHNDRATTVTLSDEVYSPPSKRPPISTHPSKLWIVRGHRDTTTPPTEQKAST